MPASDIRLNRSFAIALLVVITFRHVDSAHIPVTCSAGIAILNEEGEIRCHFHQDINESQHNFNVVHYPHSQSQVISDSGVYVLLCNWGRSKNVECKVEDGYRFNNKVSSELTVSILNVTMDKAGVYVCQLVPDGGVPVTPCSLTVRTLNEKCGTDGSCALAQQDHERPSEIHWYLIIGILACLLLGALMCMTIRLFICRTRKHTPIVYQLENKPAAVSRCCVLCVREQNANGAEDADEEQIPMRVTVAYPPNTVSKTTQIFVDVQDKNFQIGDSTARNIADVGTQVYGKEIPKEKSIKDNEVSVKVGSSIRFNNPQMYHLGKPPVIPLPNNPTAQETEYACDLAVSAFQAALNTPNSNKQNSLNDLTQTGKVSTPAKGSK